MRLATIDLGDGPRAAVVLADGVATVGDYGDVGAVLRDGAAGLQAARRAATGEARAFEESQLRRPVQAPTAVVCVGLNYGPHIIEMGRELPEQPTLFAKLPRALTDPYAEIEIPAITEKLDYEAELAVVIGTAGRNVAESAAWDHVGGLTVLNDVSARDLQNRTSEWLAGKTLQASTPFGPWIVTPDEFGDVADHEISLTVNGEERQRASLGDLVFDVAALIADLSRIVALEPGDIIATGTPGGVGAASGTFLADGDVVEATIDGIGSIRNTFRAPA
jgi:acylpyruvate hydrolase